MVNPNLGTKIHQHCFGVKPLSEQVGSCMNSRLADPLLSFATYLHIIDMNKFARTITIIVVD